MTRQETKAEITQNESSALIVAQKIARDKKTARLRDQRLARDAELEAQLRAVEVKPKRRKKLPSLLSR